MKYLNLRHPPSSCLSWFVFPTFHYTYHCALIVPREFLVQLPLPGAEL